jgi:hypothetical protein
MRWEGLAKKKMILCLGRTDRVEGNQRGFGAPVSAVRVVFPHQNSSVSVRGSYIILCFMVRRLWVRNAGVPLSTVKHHIMVRTIIAMFPRENILPPKRAVSEYPKRKGDGFR